PHTTRAKIRGEFLAKAREYGADFTVDWTRLKVNRPEPQVVEFADPFISEDERLAGLINYIAEHTHNQPFSVENCCEWVLTDVATTAERACRMGIGAGDKPMKGTAGQEYVALGRHISLYLA